MSATWVVRLPPSSGGPNHAYSAPGEKAVGRRFHLGDHSVRVKPIGLPEDRDSGPFALGFFFES